MSDLAEEELTTEVLLFEANDAFRANIDLPIPAFQVALQADGVHGPVYYGRQIEEEPHTWGIIFLRWDSREHHQALIDGPTYPTVLAGLKPAFAENARIEMYHVVFSGPTPTTVAAAAAAAFEAPVTEVAIWTLRAPENRAALVETLTGMMIMASDAASGSNVLAFGQTRENENKYVLVRGWPSVEARQQRAAQPEVAAAFERLYALASRDHHYHTELSQYFSRG